MRSTYTNVDLRQQVGLPDHVCGSDLAAARQKIDPNDVVASAVIVPAPEEGVLEEAPAPEGAAGESTG